MDIQQLHNNIHSSLTLDPLSLTHLPTPTAPNWTLDDSGLLRHHDQIYVPDANDLRLQVLQYKHDHILSGHAGQNKTLTVIQREYVWPNLRNSATSVPPASIPRPPVTNPTDSSSNSLSQSVRGTQSPWTSLNISQSPTDTPQS
jgi:hypothetical protein